MTIDDPGREWDDDEVVAAEYVLGVLSAEERDAVARRADGDPGFASLIERWEAHFFPLAAGYREDQAPPWVKIAIDQRLFPDRRPQRRPRGFWNSLVFWRGLAAAAIVVLAVMVTLPYLKPPAPTAPPLVAAVAGEEGVSYLALYEEASGRLRLSRLAGEPPAQRVFELWRIEGNSAPVSLGVLPADAETGVRLAEAPPAGTVLAISVEPGGGSPIGRPTGPVVAVGTLQRL